MSTYDNELDLKVAKIIDEDAWKSLDDGRDSLPGSLWDLRRDWALAKAARIVALISAASKATA